MPPMKPAPYCLIGDVGKDRIASTTGGMGSGMSMRTPTTRIARTVILGLLAALLMGGAGVVKADDLAYTTNADNTITIKRYLGSGGAVVIPSTIDGLRVTSIGGAAFMNRTGLTSITIPNSITSIGDAAFDQCSSLSNITIPNSVTNIGHGAFVLCANLTNITIPASVTSIGGWTFDYCTNLTAITVDASNSVYSSLDGVLFDKKQTALIQYPAGRIGSYTIPNSVTSIGEQAFAGISLTSITIPNSVTNIEESAFHWCNGLTNITIPASVVSIGGWAFGDCINLTEVYCKGNAPHILVPPFIGSPHAIIYYLPGTKGWETEFGVGGCPTKVWKPEQAFYGCTNLTAITADASNSVYSGTNGVLFDKNMTPPEPFTGRTMRRVD
jgi:hypothetical protein